MLSILSTLRQAIYRSLHLLLVQSLPSQPALRTFSALPEQAHSPGHAHRLLNPQECVGASQSPSGRLVHQLSHLSYLG